MRLLRDLNRQDGLTIIMVTHNTEILSATDRVVRLVAGKVEGGTDAPHYSFAWPPPAVNTADAAPGAV